MAGSGSCPPACAQSSFCLFLKLSLEQRPVAAACPSARSLSPSRQDPAVAGTRVLLRWLFPAWHTVRLGPGGMSCHPAQRPAVGPILLGAWHWASGSVRRMDPVAVGVTVGGQHGMAGAVGLGKPQTPSVGSIALHGQAGQSVPGVRWPW